MDQDTDVHLRWNHHQTTLLSVFSSLLKNENLVDCTISAEGQHFKAHRVILSACSPYFETLFNEHCEANPIVILPDVEFQILKALMEFMYSGEVKIPEDKLSIVIGLAETLQIKGLSSAGDSETRDDLRTKKRNGSPIFCDKQDFRNNLREHRYVSRVKQKDDVASVHTSKKFSQDTDSLLLVTQKCDNNSKSIFPEKAVEEPAVSQDITDTEVSNVFHYSSLTKTLTESNTHEPGTFLNSVYKVLDSSQVPRYSTNTTGKRRMLNEDVLLTRSTSEGWRTSEPLGLNVERPSVDHLPEIKQEDPDDITDNSIEEIILDDNTDENDYANGSGGDNSNSVRGRETPEETVGGQGSCSQEQYGDTCFVERPSLQHNKFKCDTCGRSYQYYRSLWRHLKYECGKERQFKCSDSDSLLVIRHRYMQ